MELVAIARVLRAHRLAVLLGVLLALGTAFMVERRVGEATSSGLAVERLLLGPPNAPVINRDVVDGESTMIRAKLLADVLSADSVREAIASRAGIAPDQFVVKGPATAMPWVQMPLDVRATQAAAAPGVPYVLTVEAADLNPIMTLTGGAPEEAEAARLVAAASDELAHMIAQPGNSASRLAAQSLGPIRSRTVHQVPSRILVVGAPLVVLVLWCSAVVLVGGLARRRRRPRLTALAH